MQGSWAWHFTMRSSCAMIMPLHCDLRPCLPPHGGRAHGSPRGTRRTHTSGSGAAGAVSGYPCPQTPGASPVLARGGRCAMWWRIWSRERSFMCTRLAAACRETWGRLQNSHRLPSPRQRSLPRAPSPVGSGWGRHSCPPFVPDTHNSPPCWLSSAVGIGRNSAPMR